MESLKSIGLAIGGVAVAAGLVWGAAELSFGIYAHFAPKEEAVRRATYEQSRAYQEGTVRDLENLQLEYAQATPAGKDAIRSVALHRLADVDPYLLTPGLRTFAAQLRGDAQ